MTNLVQLGMKTKWLSLSLLLLPGIVFSEVSVSFRMGPPPPPRHMVEASPSIGRGLVWTDGYWDWNGRRYVWVPGRWVRPPHRRAHWVPAQWIQTRRGWVLNRGYWR